MYLPDHFRQADQAVLFDAMERCGLAILASNGVCGPEATHLPLLLDRAAGTLTGHFARANPHGRSLEAAGRGLAIFSGPDAYVSPGWYPSKRETGKVVPTWNYVVVHASGPVRLFHEPERLRRVVERLTVANERDLPDPWSVDDAPADYLDAMLGAIVGVEMVIERLEGKWKLSQNRSDADRLGVVEGLRSQGQGAMAEAVAAQASRVSAK